MDSPILIAILGGIINMVLSSIVPCLVNKAEQPLLKDIKKVFDNNRQVILTSSFIVAITVYLALKLAPQVLSISDLGLDLSSQEDLNYDMPVIIERNEQPPHHLINLLKLMNTERPNYYR
jgi:phosphotransferase system  glucose/maltose/N-acetylglucosamine-specific IIC component